MTFGLKTIVGVLSGETRKGFFGSKEPAFGATWSGVTVGLGWTLDDIWKYVIGAHLGHLLEFLVALTCWMIFFADGQWLTDCQVLAPTWIAKVLAFNLACEAVLVGAWHWLVYVSRFARGLRPVKFNPENQYEPQGGRVGFMRSSSGHLEREILYTTLGWLQSGSWQVLMMWLWASGKLPVYTSFWSRPVLSIFSVCFVTYWREIHFYWCHRGMHPWYDRKLGLLDGDVGAFLYRHAHSLHHKSYNPGPWSGLSMHPIEHFLYYSCAWLPPLVLRSVTALHPLAFLYAKFHADIAPIGGHDGHGVTSANGDFHWLHHAKFECNYGVPFPIDFDRMCAPMPTALLSRTPCRASFMMHPVSALAHVRRPMVCTASHRFRCLRAGSAPRPTTKRSKRMVTNYPRALAGRLPRGRASLQRSRKPSETTRHRLT